MADTYLEFCPELGGGVVRLKVASVAERSLASKVNHLPGSRARLDLRLHEVPFTQPLDPL